MNLQNLQHWKRSAELAGIPEEGYKPEVKIVKDKSGISSYTFGVILNSYRYQRPMNVSSYCPLCDVVSEVNSTPERNIDQKRTLPDYIIIPNKFPIVEGFSMAVHKGVGKEEKPMFSTSQLEGLETELRKIFTFAATNGFQGYHNSDGLGASITRHEHWHLTNYEGIYNLAGNRYGFDACHNLIEESNTTFTMYDFQFAHLIFSRDCPEEIVSFLSNLGTKIGNRYENRNIPHAICQSLDSEKILIIPAKNYMEKGIGSGETAGHIVVKSREEFDRADYEFCLDKLNERLYKKEDLNLTEYI